MEAIADTGYRVALLNKNDRDHRWATALAKQTNPPLLTCEAVLAETAAQLDSSAYGLAMLRRGAIIVAFEIASHQNYVHDLALKWSDRHPDFADLCLIRMSELFPKHPIITVHRFDFAVYRRNKRESIPTLCPPN